MAFFSRGPNKEQNPYTLKDMYSSYIENIPEDNPYFVSYKQYRSITEEFYKAMMVNILEHSGEFKMPYNIGKVYINKKRVPVEYKKRLTVDWAMTNKHGKIIYHLNEHSRGYKYVFHWEKRTFTMKHKSMYRFVPTRTNKRKLAKLIKSGDYDYFEKS